MAQLPTHLGIVDLLSSLNLCYWEELLEFSNLRISPQMHLNEIKPIENLQIFSISYQYVVSKLPTIWLRLPTHSDIVDSHSFLNLCY